MPLTSSTPADSQKTETLPSPVVSTQVSTDAESTSTAESTAESATESASYVKLAMRNMVRKRGKSLTHFFLTTITLLGVLVGLSYLTR